MHPVRIEDQHSPCYAAFWETYTASFPASERRSRAAQAALFSNPRYRLDAWLEGERFLGLMAWWDYHDFRYVEHLAVAPDARSGGVGAKILRTWMESGSSPVYLEIEQVVDEHTRRRLCFYQRLGFKEDPHVHVQPPYQRGEKPVPMQVLSWPDPLSPEEYDSLLVRLSGEIWAKPD